MIRKTVLALSSLAFAGLLTLTPSQAEAQQTITCESHSSNVTRCDVDTRGGVRLVRQISSSDCIQGQSWGTDNRGIWVARGCRAQFRVGGRQVQGGYNNGGYNNNGGYDNRDNRENRGNNRSARAIANQSERMCRNVVRERYRNVRAADVVASYRGTDRNGNHGVRWAVGRTSGSCVVNPAGRVVGFQIARR